MCFTSEGNTIPTSSSPRCSQKAWTERAAQGDVDGSTNAIFDRVAANPNDVILTRILKEFRRSDRRN